MGSSSGAIGLLGILGLVCLCVSVQFVAWFATWFATWFVAWFVALVARDLGLGGAGRPFRGPVARWLAFGATDRVVVGVLVELLFGGCLRFHFFGRFYGICDNRDKNITSLIGYAYETPGQAVQRLGKPARRPENQADLTLPTTQQGRFHITHNPPQHFPSLHPRTRSPQRKSAFPKPQTPNPNPTPKGI
ncbi:hypothetical protein CFREI_02060 [Corynebacterium freiburgense]|nr:hypothetical protein CFREI_02060 [Corynebacterium freiburgense]